ncbi:glycoside hydrolase family 99-like domain-containing protein [Sphingobacterium multivorum]|uniref:glycoside hydrolase family 99-like domain-containing protein n=1 Tax=Sphingobacterium multivorum TaxID=28454 RepID=UPI003DA589E1
MISALRYRLLIIILFLLCEVSGQVKYGAYYFDGWAKGSRQITPLLKSEYADREPIWGWETSSPEIVDKQIVSAAGAGIRFFSFCWYAGNPTYLQNKGNALAYYLNSAHKKDLDFCLLIANHEGHLVTPENWNKCAQIWLKLFQEPTYLRVDGKPLLLFFSIGSLLQSFGSVHDVKANFDKLRMQADSLHVKGVTFALCTSTSRKELALAEGMGFDVITQYNNHPIALQDSAGQAVAIDKLLEAEPKFWTEIKRRTKLPVIPTITLGWDPRPWANAVNKYDVKPYYSGFNSHSVYKSIVNCNKWLREQGSDRLNENIAFIYAWNENGEGAYLTPTKKDGDRRLKALKRAIAEME